MGRSSSLVSLLALVAGTTAAQQPAGTLVVTNMNDHTATIIDAGTGRVRATVPTGEGPHEVATSRDGRWAVVTNYGVRGKPGSTLTVIDVAKAAVSRTIDLGSYQRPHGIAFYPGDTLLLVTSEATQNVLLVDFRDGSVTGTLPTSGKASHMLALAPDGNRVFTANIVDGTVTELAPRSRERLAIRPVARFVEGIAISPDGGTLWVGSNGDSIVVVMDAKQGVALDTLTGFGMPYRIAITPDGRRAVIADPVRAEIRIVDAKTREERFRIDVPRDSIVPTAEVPGSPSPEGVAVSRDGRWAFVTLQGRDRVATIDLDHGVITRLAPTGTWSDGVAFSPLVSKP